MLKRLFFLVTSTWAMLCLWGGYNRGDGSGIETKDLITAFAPMALGVFIAICARFVVTGSFRRPRGPVVYRR